MSLSALDLDDYPVVVAIDFGTTFSGCAYAYLPHDKEPKLIWEWPKHSLGYAKTPTVSLYKKVNNRYKMEAWGCESKIKKGRSDAEYIQLYKYKTQLDESADFPPWSSPVSVQDAIADYLRAMHEYAAGKIEQQLGNRFTRESFRYCLTVPAMWSDKAKDTMRQAAIQAGIIKESDILDRLMLVSEPEAAALYCERSCKEYDLKHGDRFLICDAGGGTVDLIVYDVSETSEGQTLSEVTKGHGASCGSMLIDQNFGKLLGEKFRSQGANIRDDDDLILKLVEKFAYALKPQFDGNEDLYLELPLSPFFDNLEFPDVIGIDEEVMCFTADELKKVVFDPVVEQVLELIQGQLDKAKDCNAIFLVGGFGSSAYLLDNVKRVFGLQVGTISAPHRPEIAVVFGAVYTALNPKKVTVRATRRCYGIDILQDFKYGVDPPELMVSRIDGVMCKDCFSTFVKKGQLISVDECVDHSYSIVCLGGNDNTGCRISVYAVDGDPPQYSTNLRELASISIPNPFTSIDPPGKRVACRTKFYFGMSEIRVEAIVKGKTYSTRLRFENDSAANPSKTSTFPNAREF